MVCKSVFQWKYPQPVSAQVAGEFLDKLERDNGELTPELVLDNSRDKNSVLHPCFDWDDSSAAEKYRLYQARHIIATIVRVDYNPNETDTQSAVRAYVNVSDKQKGKFVAVDVAFSHPDYRQRVLQKALEELRNFQNKYAQYKELAGVISAINDFAKTL